MTGRSGVTAVYRIDRPPAETVELVFRALRQAGAGETYEEGDVVMARVDGEWVVEVDLGVPTGLPGTLVSVAARRDEAAAAGGDEEGADPARTAPDVGRAVVRAIRAVAGPSFYRVPGVESREDGPPGGWASLDDHRAVTDTGMRSLGRPVYEVAVDDRAATVRLVRPERHDTARATAVTTPLRVARAGTGFECHFDADGEWTRRDYGDDPVTVPDGVWQRLRDLYAFGVVAVDDRLGHVEHVFPAVPTDAAAAVEHARAVVSVASTVEDAVE